MRYPLPLDQDGLGNKVKIMSLSTKNIIVRKLDYHTSEEPVDFFLTTLLVCTIVNLI